MRVTIYLSSTDSPSQQVREIRSQHTHCLLGLAGEDGLLLWDRRSRMQHLLHWTEIAELQKQLESKAMNVDSSK